METHQAAGGSDEQQICRRNSVKYGKCKHFSGDNKLQYCDFHYIILTDFLTNTITSEEIEPPPDEDRCCQSNHRWRCKNFRMGHGDDDDSSVPKRRYCEKHYNYYVNKYRNLKSGDVKSKTRKKLTGIQPPTDEQRCCRRSRTWRCKNFSMGHVRLCQKHYNDRANYLLKTSGDRTEGAGSSVTMYPNCSNKVTEENDVTGIQPPTSDIIVCGGSPNIGSGEVELLTGIRESVGTKRKNVERTEWSGQLDFTDFLIEKPNLITSNEMEKKKLPPDEQFCCVRTRKWRCKNVKMGYGAAAADASVPKTKFCEKHYNYYAEIQNRKKILEKQTSGDAEGAAGPIKRKRITGERTEGSGEPDSLTKPREPMLEFVSMENYKRKRSELSVKLEKRKLECTKFPGILSGEVETRQTAAKVELEEWNKCSDLETPTLRVENKNATNRCINSNLESLVPRNGKKNSALRWVEWHNFEKIESVAWGLQNEVTQAGEKHNTSKPNAETSSGGSGGTKDSHVFELKTEDNVLNVHGIGISKHHESKFEFPNYSAANISEDSDCSTDSEGSLGTLMAMMAMKYRNRNEDKEIKWKFEADMLSSFEEEPELCMKAVCALYRQHISEISANGLFHYSDACRCTTLAKLLMDGACEGELRKSVKELQIFDSKGVEDCKRLVASYSKQLFSIYQNGKDPFFLPATTASHGDKTAK